MWVYTSIALIVAIHSLLAESKYGRALQPGLNEKDYVIERLPTNVIPHHYDLGLAIALPGYSLNVSKEKEFTTEGLVVIAFSVTEPTRIVKLNVAETLEIQSVSLANTTNFESEEGIYTELNNRTIDLEVEMMTIRVDEDLLPSTLYKLMIMFGGAMNKKADGLYYEEHNVSHGIEYSAITQFEATFARQMVPCFDEPSFKATWNLTVYHPRGTDAISNGELLERKDQESGNMTVSIFERTPYMSSYLLALSVSNYISETGYTQKGIRVRGFAHRSLAGGALKESVQYTIKSMEKLEEIFSYNPFQKKMDFVFTPRNSGGMENWNMITYTEYMLKQNLSSLSNRDIEIIAHEVTHQWFGNLVTAEWWSELWLNEGITTYITCYLAEQIKNDMNKNTCYFETQEVSISRQYAYNLEPEVNNFTEIERQSAAAYEKGGSLARMLEEIIGHENMFEGLKNYIYDNVYDNVNRYDLVTALQSFTNVNLTRLVDQWTTQVGYPIVHVERVKQNTFKLTQTVVSRNGPNSEKFDIPIFVKNSQYEEIQVLSADADHFLLTTNGRYPIINGNNAGGYRVDYGQGWQEVILDSLTSMEQSKLLLDLVAIHLNDQKGGKSSNDELLDSFQKTGRSHGKYGFMNEILKKRYQRI